MLIGHYAPALVLQRLRPTVRLRTLFVATQLVDVAWGIFILLGVEHVRIVPGFTASNDLDLWDMPYTHSLVATVVWALVSGALWLAVRREPSRVGDAVVVAIAVASHFAGDFLVHAGDLPVFAAQGPKLGLGLWRNLPVALALETGLFACAALYWWWPRRASPGARPVFLALFGLTALAAVSFFIPTPPSPSAMAVTGLATYAGCAALAGWMERKTPDVPGPASTPAS
jgi:hypothetical protein